MERIPSLFKNRHKRNSFFASLGALLVLILLAAGFGFVAYRFGEKPDVDVPSSSLRVRTEEASSDRLSIRVQHPIGLPDSIQSKVDAWIDGFVKDMEESASGSADVETFGLPYTLEIPKPEFFVSGNTASLVLAANIYTGGAHGNQTFFTITYDTDSEKELTLSDVVGYDISYEKLSSLIRPRLLAVLRQNGTDADSMEGDVFFEEGLLPKSENFSLWYRDQGSLVFVFPPYQVAPYALGSIRVPVPLSAFLNPLP